MVVFAFVYNANSRNGPKDVFIAPKFIDSNKFVRDFVNDTGVKEYYNHLVSIKDYAVYKYGFDISTNCKLIPGIYDRPRSINNFIEKKFNKYKWSNAFLNGKKAIGYGYLEIAFIPKEHRIEIEIIMGNGSTDLREMYNKKVFHKNIKMR
jgi:hypothetical protein